MSLELCVGGKTFIALLTFEWVSRRFVISKINYLLEMKAFFLSIPTYTQMAPLVISQSLQGREFLLANIALNFDCRTYSVC